jgi:DNA-binding NarL/FixJ family response regulator
MQIAQKIKVLLVDDHQLVLEALNLVIQKNTDFTVVGKFNNADDAIIFCKNNEVDVIMLDMFMPNENGIEVTKIFKRKFPDSKVVILSMNDDESIIIKAYKVGADAYLLKNIDKQELFEALVQVNQGEAYYPKAFSPNLRFILSNKKYNLSKVSKKKLITLRERDIIKELLNGKSYKEIGDKLFISARTVNTHITNIYKKMGVKNAIELINCLKKDKLL